MKIDVKLNAAQIRTAEHFLKNKYGAGKGSLETYFKFLVLDFIADEAKKESDAALRRLGYSENDITENVNHG